MAPDPAASPPAPPPAWGQRLVEQLQLLSEITEHLTYRLLDMEERLIEAEKQLGQQRQASQHGDALPETMERWLLDTEVRIARVEDLLTDNSNSRPTVPGASLAKPAARGEGGRPDLEVLAGRSGLDRDDADVSAAEAERPYTPAQSA